MASYLNIRDAADYLGISPHTLYKLVERSEVPAAKVGGSWRLNPETLDEFLQAKLPGKSQATSRRNRSLEILIVERDEQVRRDLASMAMSRGARPQMAGSLEDAVLLLAGDPPDLVLYGVPDDQTQALEFLRQVRLVCSDCRIALMVAPDRAAELGELMEFGPLIMLRTPVERPDMVSLIALI